MIWATPDLEATSLIAAFGSRTATLHRTDKIGTLLRDEGVRVWLEYGELASLARQIDPETLVELLVWEGACKRQDGQLVVAIFDASTGRVLSVGDAQLLFVRVAVS